MNNLKKYKEDGGNLNVKDPFGNSPIFLAISLGNKDATNFLIDSNCDLTVTDMRGRGFLHYAAEFGPPSLILRFFQKRLEQSAEKWKFSGNIHNAAYYSFEQFVEVLVPFGVPDITKDDGSNEIRQQAEAEDGATEQEKPDTIALAHAYFDSQIDTSMRALHGETPLHLAAQAGSVWAVAILLSLYSRIQAEDNCGLSPLHYAIKAQKLKTASLLINSTADINARDKEGNTPIHLAALNNFPEGIKLLKENNANINAKNAIGRTALHYAAELGNRQAVQELLDQGADPNVRDVNGWAALRLAIKGGFDDIQELLVEKGTRPY